VQKLASDFPSILLGGLSKPTTVPSQTSPEDTDTDDEDDTVIQMVLTQLGYLHLDEQTGANVIKLFTSVIY
jgi:hypothetical protein